MKNKPLVSVIIPVYNVKKYISECLDSVIGQDYDNLEIIIVDDGATDGSGKVCDEYAEKDKRTKVFHKKNGGLSDARNYGIKKATGELVALVDSDDNIKTDFISKMVDEMMVAKADIAVCGFNSDIPEKTIMSGKEATEKLLIQQENIEIVAWNKIYKKELFEGISYPVGEKHEDSLTTYKLLAKAKKVAYINESLYCYREREGSIMKTGKVEERLKYREKAAREAIEYFKGDKELAESAKVSLMLAKYAFIDASIKGKIGQEYYDENIKWVKEHKKEYVNNQKMTGKLKLYNMLVTIGLYKAFRKIL